MLYLGIDQHKRQLTVDLLGEDGSGVLKRQVSTEWDKVRTFFADLAEKARPEGGFLENSGPGGPGRFPARGSHRPERAQLTHSVPQVIRSLRFGTPSGRTAGMARGSGPQVGRTSRLGHAMPAVAAEATSARPGEPRDGNGPVPGCCP